MHLVIFMEFIICLDDKNGMLFNNRRQSRDKAVCEDVIKSLDGKKLRVLPFSEQLFSDFSENVSVVSEIGDEGTYFIENIDIRQYSDVAEKITVYYWNRIYPSDLSCSIDFSKLSVVSQTEFQGNSHDKITKTVYGR